MKNDTRFEKKEECKGWFIHTSIFSHHSRVVQHNHSTVKGIQLFSWLYDHSDDMPQNVGAVAVWRKSAPEKQRVVSYQHVLDMANLCTRHWPEAYRPIIHGSCLKIRNTWPSVDTARFPMSLEKIDFDQEIAKSWRPTVAPLINDGNKTPINKAELRRDIDSLTGVVPDLRHREPDDFG
jgi:hypothetical protein